MALKKEDDLPREICQRCFTEVQNLFLYCTCKQSTNVNVGTNGSPILLFKHIFVYA